MSKPDLSSSGIGKSKEAMVVRRLGRIERSAAKVKAKLHPDTFPLEAQLARLDSDRQETANLSEAQLAELEAKLERKNWLRGVRWIMTGQKNKMADPPAAYRVFEFIYKNWHKRGEPHDGVPFLIKEIAKGVRLNPDYVKEMLHTLVGPHVHIEKRARKPSLYCPKCP